MPACSHQYTQVVTVCLILIKSEKILNSMAFVIEILKDFLLICLFISNVHSSRLCLSTSNNLYYCTSYCVYCIALGSKHKNVLMTTVRWTTVEWPSCSYFRKLSCISQALTENLFYAKQIL